MANAVQSNWRNGLLAGIVAVTALLAIAWWWGALTPANPPSGQAPSPELVAPQTPPAPPPQSTPTQPQ